MAGEFGFVFEAGGAVDDEGRLPDHAAEVGGLLEGGEQFGDRETVAAGVRVGLGVAAGRDRGKETFAAEAAAAGAVGEAGREDEVLPFLQERGAAVPVKRMLEDDGVAIRPTARGYDFLNDLQALFLPPPSAAA